jgi:hypothetical protein
MKGMKRQGLGFMSDCVDSRRAFFYIGNVLERPCLLFECRNPT